MKTRLDNEIKLYGDKYAVTLLDSLVAKYSSIWKSENFV